MTEKERLKVVRDIKKDIEKISEINEKQKKEQELLTEIKKIPAVEEYINLKEEIKNLKASMYYKGYSIDEIIGYEFETNFVTYRSDKFSDCSHDIWILEGSYGTEYECYDYYTISCENEDDIRFIYNKYVCLECGETVCKGALEYEDFEKNHFVLKNDERDINDMIYRQLYFKYLYNNTTKDAKKMIIDKFNKDEQKKIKQRTL